MCTGERKLPTKLCTKQPWLGLEKKYRISGQIRKLLNVRRVPRENWWVPKVRKLRKDEIPPNIQQKVEEWFMSSAIAREVPCKRSVKVATDTEGSLLNV